MKKMNNYLKRAQALAETAMLALAKAEPEKVKAVREGKVFAVNPTDETKGSLYIYDAIGSSFWYEGVTADSVRSALAAMPKVKTLDVFINSPGGDVFEGKAIFTQLKRFAADGAEVVMHIDGIAASAASFVAMAGTRIITSSVASWMIHNAWTMAAGNANDLQGTVDLLKMLDGDIAQMYANKTGKPVEEMRALMDAETWMTAEKALELGFTDSVETFDAPPAPPPKDTAKKGIAALCARIDAAHLAQEAAAALLTTQERK